MKFIVFMDNCFGYNIDWLKEFSYEYRNKIGLRFGCVMHPGHITSDSVGYLKFAGCYAVNLGIQSWSEEIRKKFWIGMSTVI